MTIFANRWLGLGACVVAATLSVSSAAYAQSDTDYLSALDTMVVDMDLDGLAGQTFETQTVAAPQLSMLANTVVVDCETVIAQAEDRGVPLEIFGADASLSEEQLAALSECMMPETGTVMSYLIPNS